MTAATSQLNTLLMYKCCSLPQFIVTGTDLFLFSGSITWAIVSGGVTAALSNRYVTVTLSLQLKLRCSHRYRCGDEGNRLAVTERVTLGSGPGLTI